MNSASHPAPPVGKWGPPDNVLLARGNMLAQSNHMAGKTRIPKTAKLLVRSSRIHGLGLFSGENIQWGERLIAFEGQRIGKKEAKRRERFYNSIGYICLLEVSDGHYIDGTVGGNESRFINNSQKPNVGAIREGEGIVFYALNDIANGEELTFDYGFDPGLQDEP